MTELPTVISKSGLQPQSPASLLAQLLAAVAAARPGYTADLPGSLIEDVSSTEVAALALADAARVETVNSLTPYGANAFLLTQLAQIYIGQGTAPGVPTNTSVFVIFYGPPGYVVPVGFVVSDGVYQYVVQDGGVIGSGGQSSQLFCLANTAGSWSVSTNTVNQLVTSVPTGVDLSCSNPSPGVPGGAAETEEQFRARVIAAGQAVGQGMPTMLKTLLGKVSGVQSRLVSVLQKTGGWEVIVGGGDPYEVAYAIFSALFDVSTLVGSVLNVTNISQANPGVVTTSQNHGYQTGQAVVITQVVGMSALNGLDLVATVVDTKRFSIGVDTRGFPAYVSGGVCSPNLRNVSVNLSDYPDAYNVVFVNPPQQAVVIDLTWGTTQPNFVSQSAVAQLGNPAIVDYVNSIPAGAALNVFEMQSVFQQAVSSVIDPALVTRMLWAVSIDGVPTIPVAGTGIILGDPESYFQTTTSQVVITQG